MPRLIKKHTDLASYAKYGTTVYRSTNPRPKTTRALTETSVGRMGATGDDAYYSGDFILADSAQPGRLIHVHRFTRSRRGQGKDPIYFYLLFRAEWPKTGSRNCACPPKGQRSTGQRASRVRRYKSIETLARASGSVLTLDNFITMRFLHKTAGWTAFKLTEGERVPDAWGAAEALGGRIRTTNKIANLFRYATGAKLYKALGATAKQIRYNPGVGWRFSAGQDGTAETARMRRWLMAL